MAEYVYCHGRASWSDARCDKCGHQVETSDGRCRRLIAKDVEILGRVGCFVCPEKDKRIARLTEENGRLREELRQCHEELAEAWEVNLESVDVILAEKLGRI